MCQRHAPCDLSPVRQGPVVCRRCSCMCGCPSMYCCITLLIFVGLLEAYGQQPFLVLCRRCSCSLHTCCFGTCYVCIASVPTRCCVHRLAAFVYSSSTAACICPPPCASGNLPALLILLVLLLHCRQSVTTHHAVAKLKCACKWSARPRLRCCICLELDEIEVTIVHRIPRAASPLTRPPTRLLTAPRRLAPHHPLLHPQHRLPPARVGDRRPCLLQCQDRCCLP